MTAEKIEFYQKVANAVVSARLKKEMTQNDVALKIGMHRVNYCRFESGMTAIKADTLFHLLKLLKIEPQKIQNMYKKKRRIPNARSKAAR